MDEIRDILIIHNDAFKRFCPSISKKHNKNKYKAHEYFDRYEGFVFYAMPP